MPPNDTGTTAPRDDASKKPSVPPQQPTSTPPPASDADSGGALPSGPGSFLPPLESLGFDMPPAPPTQQPQQPQGGTQSDLAAEVGLPPRLGGDIPAARMPQPTTSPPAMTPLTTAPIPPNEPPLPPQIPPAPSIPTPAIVDEEKPSGNIQNDITRILADVKLPERPEFRAQADTKPPPVPVPPPIPTTPPPAEAPKESRPIAPVTIANAIQHTAQTDSVIVPVHTLKDDLQNVVRDQKVSLVRAAALEQEKRAHKPPQMPMTTQSARRGWLVRTLLVIGIFVLLGAAALGGVAIVMQDRSRTGENVFASDSLLFSEQTVPFPLDNEPASEIKRLIASARFTQSATLGAVTRVAPLVSTGTTPPQERLATTREFFSSIGANASEELLRALGDEFFFGFHMVDEHAPILVIPVTSYERAFAGMLQWETVMNTDLAPIFTAVPILTRQSNGLLAQRVFDDAVMRNFDVRALRDDAGVIQLFYSFPTRDLLVIAESEYSFAEILARLRADRRL